MSEQNNCIVDGCNRRSTQHSGKKFCSKHTPCSISSCNNLEYKSTGFCCKHATQNHYGKGINFIRKEFSNRKVGLQTKASYEYKAKAEFEKGVQIACITNQLLDAKILLHLATYEMIQENHRMAHAYGRAVIVNSNATPLEIQRTKELLQGLN